MQFDEKRTMQIKELEKAECLHAKSKENGGLIGELEAPEKNRGEGDLSLNSVIDVSGKVLDYRLIDGEESAVEKVYMYKNELNLIPGDIGRLKGLKKLKFFANEVNLFPREFRNLVELESLQVKVTEPGVSGLELSKLENLKELELSRVPPRPSAFPILSEIAALKRLTRLSICHFSIRYIPPEIGYLSNLEYLDLSFNKMRNLPDEITLLTSLISLRVANNKLADLPLGLSNLQRLENLDLSNNRLTSLECLELESMHNLQSLCLQHNQLSYCRIPSWICCNLEGNNRDLDESAEMDVYEGDIGEIHKCPCSPVVRSSHLSGSSPNNRCLAARRARGWKRRYNLQTKARQERLNSCRKWKEDYSDVVDAELDQKDLLEEDKVHEHSVTSATDEVTDEKGSVDGCSCSATVSDGSQSSAILDSVSDTVEVPDKGPCAEASNSSVLNSKRHSEEDLDYPKPTKHRKATNDPSHLSCKYSRISFCGTEDHLPDGFYDAGRDRPFMPLANYETNLYVNSREVILLDREKDEELDAILSCAQAWVCQFRQMNSPLRKHRDFAIDNFQTASLLALFVSDHFGGSDKSSFVQRTRKAASGANCCKPFVCTCVTGINGDTDTANKQRVDDTEDNVFLDICEKSLRSIKEKRRSVIVPIGGLQFGVCRHRALLMKYLCDRMKPPIPCELVRGYLDFLPHAWNVVIIRKGDSLVRMIVDACYPHDIREESDPEYFCRYIPLSRVEAVVDHDASASCRFPSLSMCDEIGKLPSTSLMRCTMGSMEAAVKVRTIDVNGASADDIRNFELSCLGEVRMLSVLKHSCIVELYGHQILAKWPPTSDGNSGGRSLQSAIFMEYIRGGSLRNYVEKLSNDGKEHVAPGLALSIARDVAFALTELHAKNIIHRDIKSENVLIDLEKKREDGTPVVKICDFDRAIPLHSYLHTCCIAHAGIPPPDVCVGTPRWMAPEVFRAMHNRNLYGLEVDIWSFGCLLLELLTLKVPYYGLPEIEIHNLLQMGERPKLTDELDALAQSDGEHDTESETLRCLAKLYHQCTEKSPADRPSAQNIYDLLLARANAVSDSTQSERE